MNRRDAILAVLIAVALLGVIATALVIGDDRQGRPDWEEPNPVARGAPEGLERFYAQDLEWDECENAQCTSIEVPLEYEKPEGKTLSLRVHVLPSSGDGGRSLFFNPGGPGAAAIPYVDYMASQLGRDVRARYDLVFLDPRGVGESSPLDCLSDRDLDAALASDPTPDDAAEIAAFRTSSADVRCRVPAEVRRSRRPRLHRGGRPRLRHRSRAPWCHDLRLFRGVLRLAAGGHLRGTVPNERRPHGPRWRDRHLPHGP